ncbi:hypothetical protein C8R46DRAFT_460813 [Mycena filopes]|nr:hypothetical protein C8R46DRAFT_460813 [Mycena filopes]
MTVHLLDLPPEILVLIFSSLTLPALTTCLATNRRVKSLIDGSALLQYRLAAHAACVEDNPWNTNMTSVHKLATLRRREKYFTELRPSSIRNFEIDDFFVHNYGLSGDILVLTERDSKVLKWVSLAAHEPILQQLEFPGYIQELLLAIPEEDLLAILLTSNPVPETNQNGASVGDIQLHFYEMSTQSAHRMAHDPVIHVSLSGEGVAGFDVDICGSKIALLVHYLLSNGSSSHLLIYDWKQGCLLMDMGGDHSTMVFLSPEVALLPQKDTGTLELWPISENVTAGSIIVGPHISLKLPCLANPGIYGIVTTESNPKGHVGRIGSQTEPFHSSSTDSIILFQVFILHDNHPETPDLDLVLSRRALLRLLYSSQAQDGKELLWREWGPPIAHWLKRDIFDADAWPPIVCGQRRALADFVHGHIRILDFNPYTQRKVVARPGPGGEKIVAGSSSSVLGKEGSTAEVALYDLSKTIFGEPVSSELSFVVADSPKGTKIYNGVLLDEKWIVGIQDTMEANGTVSFDIWHLD